MNKKIVRQIVFAQRVCGLTWPEDIKANILGQHLADKAQTYYRRLMEIWGSESQTLEHAMQSLLQNLNTKILPAKSVRMFKTPRASHRSWMKLFLYLAAVSDVCGGADTLVLDNIVHYENSYMRSTMLSRLDIYRATSYAKLKSWRNSHSRQKFASMRRT